MPKMYKSALVAAAAFAAIGAGVSTAEAGGKHGFHRFHHFGGVGITIGGGYGGGYGCGYLFDRWQYSGSRYWKRQYFRCINGF